VISKKKAFCSWIEAVIDAIAEEETSAILNTINKLSQQDNEEGYMGDRSDSKVISGIVVKTFTEPLELYLAQGVREACMYAWQVT
jgi:hypothetical protein